MKNLISTAAITVLLTPSLAVASTINLDLTLRIDRMYTPDVTVYEELDELSFDELDFADDIWGFPVALNDQKVNDLISFKTTIDNDAPNFFNSTGQAVSCALGSFDCSTSMVGFAYADVDKLEIVDTGSPYFYISGSTRVGETIYMGYCNGGGWCSYSTDDFLMFSEDSRYNFTVMSSNVSVVPLPASLPLLAASLFGLGFWRRCPSSDNLGQLSVS